MEKKVIKPRDKSKKHRIIVHAAMGAFSELGYYTTSMDHIAKLANVSKATVYNHFSSKEALFECIISDYLSEQMTHKQFVFDPHSSLEDQLYGFTDAEIWLVNIPERMGLAKVLTSVFLRQPELAMKARAICKNPQEPLILWLKAAHSAGFIFPKSAEYEAGLFYSMIEGTITWPAIFAGLPGESELMEIKRDVVKMFLSRLRGK